MSEVVEAELEPVETAIVPVNRTTALPARRMNFTPTPDVAITIELNGVDSITVTPEMVDKLIMPGMPVNEAIRFLLVCRQAGLNPFGKEIYINKQANDKGKMEYMFIVGQQAWRRLAHQHPLFGGMVYNEYPHVKEGKPVRYGEAKVWRKGQPSDPMQDKEPYVQTVDLAEVTKKGYAEKQPREFLRGVTEARALRHAFPDKFSGLYEEGERAFGI